ncbi:hypothetical protein LZZ90_05390 [Flavobacterium sp. SM15]|uniref:hypothetical protein n=1 Tax=Flavobacterium sp. SM15 TaxID=2908005 RepID=UPI001EDA50AA|nr:hypothetical protein [Flavobacterium sp. SM15]MCG2610934.1 hypothetical protein [Flavobacterium sp. SM15]
MLRSSKCPEGSSEVWSFDVHGFNFKRPKFGCLSGFSFCIKGEWTFEGCKGNSTGQLYPANPALTERGTHVVAIPISSNTLVLLFPKNLINKPGNVPEEFSLFSVDEELMIGDMKLIKGGYKTEIKEDLIVIKVPFE